MSYVYLIHFSEAIGGLGKASAKHYIGYAKSSLRRRLKEHRSGEGSKICRAAVFQYGRELILARYWRNGDRELERKLKKQHNHARFCPLCNPEISRFIESEKSRPGVRRKK
ncbi:GIY-YIG nuclease family protein [Anabaena azotica]|uniref:GIY-YIG nuclease family protein n=1 Tax=Anabaena azotica FACHB-119 TaxID=947527 RepID=A0ABR8DAB4_9NOST|nr:GIY-YIG nuclease family protein [Anabaena azotica]MBD2503881.1 GIY-YIG nuclease family protein [Anabaena azotica FACHB-119]